MPSDKLPYINVAQSAMVVPPAPQIPFALDIKILPDKNVPPEPFFGVWLVDISGSMQGERLQNVKDSLIEQVNLIPDDSIVSIITFETEIEDVILNMKIDENSRKQIAEKVKTITDRGTTSLYAALRKGIDVVRGYRGELKIKKIYLLTDGEPTDLPVKTGENTDPNYQKYFILAKEALEYKASVDTVGALGEHNVFLLYEIAKQSTGKYIFAENEEEMKTKMVIATEQTMKIAFSQPTMTIMPKNIPAVGEISLEMEDAAQYKPTVIRMPFDKKGSDFLAHFRSFEAGDTYQILVKGKISLNPDKLPMDQPLGLMDLVFDFGKPGLQTTQTIQIKFTQDQSKYKLNQEINKRYAQIFSQAEEIADMTIKGDASATQKIQGDETKKVNN